MSANRESCYAAGCNLTFNNVFRNFSAQPGDHNGIERYLRGEYRKRNGIKKSVLRREEVLINFLAILFLHKTTFTSSPKHKTRPGHSGQSFLMYSQSTQGVRKSNMKVKRKDEGSYLCPFPTGRCLLPPPPPSSAYLFLHLCLLSPLLLRGPLTLPRSKRPQPVYIWSRKGTDLSETWECVKVD